jgi:hypothetical protein
MNVALQSKRRVGQMMGDIRVVHDEMKDTASALVTRSEALGKGVDALAADAALQDEAQPLLAALGQHLDAIGAAPLAD